VQQAKEVDYFVLIVLIWIEQIYADGKQNSKYKAVQSDVLFLANVIEKYIDNISYLFCECL